MRASPVQRLLAFWAKLGSSSYRDGYHPVLCHLVDVASVCHALWQSVLREPVRSRLGSALGLDPRRAGLWVSFWVGAHDIGKVAPGFQAKDPHAEAALKGQGYNFPASATKPPHGTVSTAVLRRALAEPGGWLAIPRDLAARVATTVGGYHGVFPRAQDIIALSHYELGNQAWSQARLELLAALAATLQADRLPAPRSPAPDDHAFFMLLAGLTSVADWVGSDQVYFPFAGADVDLGEYAARARERANMALDRLGWTGWTGDVSPARFEDLFDFPRPIILRPMQRVVVDQAAGPARAGLVLIEAPMGEGKTEAALFLSDWWNRTLDQGGLYVALPTQATSNQMFGRVRKFLARRYPEERVNLHLLHGHALLLEEYQQLRLAAIYDDAADRPNQVVAEGWFTPKKRGLLAPFAVGTIDQVLLAVLQTRHGFVRLFGLANKTVILDEVHAYDAYMSTLLERLLEWLAALGCSVVLLSATLPKARRRRLLAAFGAGDVADTPYPRLLAVRDGITTSTSFPASRSLTIDTKWLPQEALPGRLREALSDGGCAAVICNTVGAAQKQYQSLRAELAPAGVEVNLFHARFPFGRRDEIEQVVLRRYGKDGERPKAAVLVATQVIEQSLDLDFDLLITEPAPVDLVLQRAGRLHRHPGRVRPGPLMLPSLWLLQPPVGDGGVPDFGTSAFVYDRHILLRSYLAMRGRAEVRLPEDIEGLVEAVYGDSAMPAPDLAWEKALGESREELEQGLQKDRQTAARFLIKPPDYADDILEDFCQELEEDNPRVHPTLQALTRLGELTVNVVCLFRSAAGLCLHPDGTGPVDLSEELVLPKALPQVKRLLRASVSLSHIAVVRHFLAQTVPSEWQRNALLRHHRAAEFSADGVLHVGKYTLRLNPELGVIIEKTGEVEP
jgi:CRISPR-associated endonuclease/helicase Cas3